MAFASPVSILCLNKSVRLSVPSGPTNIAEYLRMRDFSLCICRVIHWHYQLKVVKFKCSGNCKSSSTAQSSISSCFSLILSTGLTTAMVTPFSKYTSLSLKLAMVMGYTSFILRAHN